MTRNEKIAARIRRGVESLEAIGASYGISKERVRQIGVAQGVSRERVPLPRRARVGPRIFRTCRRCGARTSKYAEHLRLKHDRAARARILTLSQVAEIVDLYRRGYGYVRIGRAFDIGFSTVKWHLVQAGVQLRPVGGYSRSLPELEPRR